MEQPQFVNGTASWERLWAPHRKDYLQNVAGQDSSDCPFCFAPTQPDSDGLIVHRGSFAYVVMNKYPYNAGHLLVCTYRHVAMYDELTLDETTEVSELTATAMRVLRAVSNPQGFNIGMNQGKVAGAGIAGHLHQHIVPRWNHDQNFMPIIGATKVMSSLVEDSRVLLAQAWPS
jgi:ATP adenylyltransferase